MSELYLEGKRVRRHAIGTKPQGDTFLTIPEFVEAVVRPHGGHEDAIADYLSEHPEGIRFGRNYFSIEDVPETEQRALWGDR